MCNQILFDNQKRKLLTTKKFLKKNNMYLRVVLFAGFLIFPLACPSANNRWRSNDDLGKIYDNATPNPTGSLSGPWFDLPHSGNVTGVIGHVAYLACRVKNLGNFTVSWLRSSDTHLLTTGLYTYTQDRRFTGIHRTSSEDWVLEISELSLADGGMYVCQVSTTPVRSHRVHLTVAEPTTVIYGGPELLRRGSQINLTCEIRDYPKEIRFIFWFKDGKSLSNKNQRYNISMMQSDPDLAISWCMVNSAEVQDSGTYHCSSDAGISNKTSIHVITEETRAGLMNSAEPMTQIHSTFTMYFLFVGIILSHFPQYYC